MDPNYTRHDRVRLKCIVLGAAGAGKTSILRRFFSGTFNEKRVPTLGSDFYTGRVRNPLRHALEEKKDESWVDLISSQDFVSLQMWDTAGRERKAKFTAALSDTFFRHADAAMLVYDATSSTSFTQLLRWHTDLMERMRNLDGETRERPFPVLIVANKMDIIEKTTYRPEQTTIVPQRDILGVKKRFTGKDSRYEYRASAPLKQKGSTQREVISTYMATGDTPWTTDGSYLDSVLNTEDRSHPDMEMVRLWCIRNGLQIVEVSALNGSGVDAAMEALVELALTSFNERALEKQQESGVLFVLKAPASFPTFRRNEELDLAHRYAPAEQKWCFSLLRPFHWCK
jgi:small GTP-binding protein